MGRKKLIAAVVGWLVLATASLALCADIVGTVTDVNNKPVPAVRISVRDASGKILGDVLTDSQGKYQITGLNTGAYDYLLDPKGTGFQPGTAAAYLGDKGLTIDWRVSKGANAVALAAQGTGNTVLAGDPFGMSAETFAAVLAGGGAVIVGGSVGGLAAASAFGGGGNGHPHPHPHSPSK